MRMKKRKMLGEAQSSAALATSLVALTVALGGAAVAIGGAGVGKSQFNLAAHGPTQKSETIFKRFRVDAAREVIVAKQAGFKVKAVCEQDQISAYVIAPPDVPIDGVSDVDAEWIEGEQLRLNDPQADSNGWQVSSFAIATIDGRVMSGNLGYSYPGSPGIFGGQNKCVVYGHLSVG